MLSRFLQILLFTGACVTSLLGIADLTIQLRQKPFSGKASNNGTWSFGSPGFHFTAYRNDGESTPMAPDTVISFKKIDSSGRNMGTGESHSRNRDNWLQDSLMAYPLQPRLKKVSDTTIYLFATMNPSFSKWFVPNYGNYTSQSDGSVEYTEYSSDSPSQRILERRVYPNMRAAVHAQLLKNYDFKYNIDEEGPVFQNLIIHPKGRGQLLLFISMILIKWASAALLLFLLSFLFRNFGRRQFFDPRNTRILFRCGWLLILPELAAFCFYWFFLFRIIPAKLRLGDEMNTQMVSSFAPQSFVNWQLFFLGLGLLALSAVFRIGHRMKEKESLTI